MFSLKSTFTLAASLTFLIVSIVHTVEAVEIPTGFVEGQEYNYVYLDQVTHKPVYGFADGISKRNGRLDGNLLYLLRQHKAQAYCQSLCPQEYFPQKPVTVFKTKSTTKTLTKTSTTCLYGCRPATKTTTVKGSPSPASTSTKTSTTISSITSIVTEATVFSTAVETSTISTSETSTVTEPTATISDTSFVTSTSTDIEPGPQTTSTISIPVQEAPDRVRRYNIQPPSYLKSYTNAEIAAACKAVFPPPSPKTVTSTVTKTRVSTKTRTLTSTAKEGTTTVTTHPPASTIKVQTTTTSETTFFTTTIPSTTTSTTTSTEITSTILETTTPSTTVSTTSSTTTTTTTFLPGSTTTVCQGMLSTLAGIGTPPPGFLHFPDSHDAVSCCTICFNTPGCTGWELFLGNCVYGAGGPSESPPDSLCPNGKSDIYLYTGGTFQGGPGPCTNNLNLPSV